MWPSQARDCPVPTSNQYWHWPVLYEGDNVDISISRLPCSPCSWSSHYRSSNSLIVHWYRHPSLRATRGTLSSISYSSHAVSSNKAGLDSKPECKWIRHLSRIRNVSLSLLDENRARHCPTFSGTLWHCAFWLLKGSCEIAQSHYKTQSRYLSYTASC